MQSPIFFQIQIAILPWLAVGVHAFPGILLQTKSGVGIILLIGQLLTTPLADIECRDASRRRAPRHPGAFRQRPRTISIRLKLEHLIHDLVDTEA